MGEDTKQQRRFFRLEELDLPAKYRVVGKDIETQEETEFIDTSVKDLSAGGLSFIVLEPLETGTEIQIMFKLPNIDVSLNLLGEIARVIEAGKKYEAGIKFLSVDEVEQDKIMSFIFQKQLELRRRGLR